MDPLGNGIPTDVIQIRSGMLTHMVMAAPTISVVRMAASTRRWRMFGRCFGSTVHLQLVSAKKTRRF